ncbi:ig(immunoglobulin) and lrr(leucine rich repeat) domain [Holotrichia oblita]|uniref:Ig(Immunoglobulin) and lrr(Leucine rich repeat) domain n=1 Tax=Holotrichia oblita TaxID=644536 RepID=A0ACB9SU37_HOLOL|nr:ig(immunoglobulin) and lrr(leucine rich repeat) domain [Holotrichia oblita]
MRMLHVLVVMYYVISSPSVYCELCQSTCHIVRVKGLKSADCYGKELTRIPQCLSGGIELLDIGHNRIREIFEEDFRPYSYLEHLYLAENILTDIDEKALEYLTSLYTLDLSSTALYKIPSGIFSLPVLNKLRLGGIRNPKMVDDIEEASPVTSPLVYLDLSNNKLKRLPILGEVPTLEVYNVTSNTNVKLNTTMFAGLCNLQELVDINFTTTFDSACDCYVLEQWLTARHVKFTRFNCGFPECTNQVPIDDLNIYNSCRRLHEAQQQQIYKKKLLTNVGISMGTIALFLLIVLYFIIRRHRKQKKKTEEQAQKQRKEAIDDLL